MEKLFKRILANWYVISTLKKDEKLIVHVNGTFTKDPYSLGQWASRRVAGHGLQETYGGLDLLWDCTTATVDSLMSHEALNQIRFFPLSELKELEIASYREKTIDLNSIADQLKVVRATGLKNFIETYHNDCTLEQLGQSIDALIAKIDYKLSELQKLESELVPRTISLRTSTTKKVGNNNNNHLLTPLRSPTLVSGIKRNNFRSNSRLRIWQQQQQQKTYPIVPPRTQQDDSAKLNNNSASSGSDSENTEIIQSDKQQQQQPPPPSQFSHSRESSE